MKLKQVSHSDRDAAFGELENILESDFTVTCYISETGKEQFVAMVEAEKNISRCKTYKVVFSGESLAEAMTKACEAIANQRR